MRRSSSALRRACSGTGDLVEQLPSTRGDGVADPLARPGCGLARSERGAGPPLTKVGLAATFGRREVDI